jgi:hypothetical protein
VGQAPIDWDDWVVEAAPKKEAGSDDAVKLLALQWVHEEREFNWPKRDGDVSECHESASSDRCEHLGHMKNLNW